MERDQDSDGDDFSALLDCWYSSFSSHDADWCDVVIFFTRSDIFQFWPLWPLLWLFHSWFYPLHPYSVSPLSLSTSTGSDQLLPVVLRWRSCLLANSPRPLRRQQHQQLQLRHSHTHLLTHTCAAGLTHRLSNCISGFDYLAGKKKSLLLSKWRGHVHEHMLASQILRVTEAHPVS